jgi:hypothetical protein
MGDDDIGLETNEFRGKFGHPLRSSFTVSLLDDDVFTFDIPQLS